MTPADQQRLAKKIEKLHGQAYKALLSLGEILEHLHEEEGNINTVYYRKVADLLYRASYAENEARVGLLQAVLEYPEDQRLISSGWRLR